MTSRNDYDRGVKSLSTSYGAVQKFDLTADNRTYGVGTGSSCFKCGDEGHWARDCPITSSSTTNNVRAKKISGCFKFNSNTFI